MIFLVVVPVVPFDIKFCLPVVGPRRDLDVVEEAVVDDRADVAGQGEDLFARLVVGPGFEDLYRCLLRDVLRKIRVPGGLLKTQFKEI